MPTDLQIANRALREVGAQPLTQEEFDNPVSVTAKVVTDAYEGALEDVLSEFDWPINRAVTSLLVGDTGLPTVPEFSHHYDLSPYSTDIRRITDVDGASVREYRVIGNLLYTKASSVYIHYDQVQTDISVWPMALARVAVYALAMAVANPLSADADVSETLRSKHAAALASAKRNVLEQAPVVTSAVGYNGIINRAITESVNLFASDLRGTSEDSPDRITYDVDRLAQLLEQNVVSSASSIRSLYDWPELRTVAELTDTAAFADPRFLYAHTLPADYVALRAVLDSAGTSIPDFSVSGGVLYTNVDSPFLVYTADALLPDDWPDYLQEALIYHLASGVSTAATGVPELKDYLYKVFLNRISEAKSRLRTSDAALSLNSVGSDLINQVMIRTGLAKTYEAASDEAQKFAIRERVEQVLNGALPTSTDFVRSEYDWPELRKTSNLSSDNGAPADARFANSFSLPADYVSLLAVHTSTGATISQFRIEGSTLLVTEASPSLLYISSDLGADQWPAYLQEILLHHLTASVAEAAGLAAGAAAELLQAYEAITGKHKARLRSEGSALSLDPTNSDLLDQVMIRTGLSRAYSAMPEQAEKDKLRERVEEVLNSALPASAEFLRSEYDWPELRASSALSPDLGAPVDSRFTSSFALPSDFVALQAVHDASGTSIGQFRIEGATLLVSDATPSLLYTSSSVATDNWPAYLTELLTLHLSAAVAESVGQAPEVSANLFRVFDYNLVKHRDRLMSEESALTLDTADAELVNYVLIKTGASAAYEYQTKDEPHANKREKLRERAEEVIRAMIPSAIGVVAKIYDWPSFRASEVLVESATASTDPAYLYAYDLPADCMLPRSITDANGCGVYDYKVSDTRILANDTDLTLNYSLSLDIAEWPEYLAELLRVTLALRTVMALTGRIDVYRTLSRESVAAISEAKTLASRQDPTKSYMPDVHSAYLNAHYGNGTI